MEIIQLNVRLGDNMEKETIKLQANEINIKIKDQCGKNIGTLTLNGIINQWSTTQGNFDVTKWSDDNNNIEIKLDGDFMANEWLDDLDDEEDLMCLDWHEYHEQDPYFVDKEEIEQIFKNATEYNDPIRAKKINENRYEVTFNADLLYFVCPVNAREQIKKDWKELKWLFKEYE